MKIQINFSDPSQVNSGREGITIAFGVIESHEKIGNCVKSRLYFDVAEDRILASKKTVAEISTPRTDILSKNEIGRSPLEDMPTHEILTKPIFEITQIGNGVSIADILIMESDIPSKSKEGNHTYYFVGIVSGEIEKLSKYHSRILELDFTKRTSEHGSFTYALATDTGVKCEHEIGTHFTSELELPIWGFGEEKVGRIAKTSDFLTKAYYNHTKEFYDSQKNGQEADLIFNNPFGYKEKRFEDSGYAAYVIALGNLGGLPNKIWLTEDELKEKNKLSRKAMRASLAQEEGLSL